MSAPRVVRRKCPDCGAPLIASSGVAWMPCSACPIAVNLFRTPIERIRCRRVEREGSKMLPFYRFAEGDDERWIPAFRSAGNEPYAMARELADLALTFADGPCALPLGRGVSEARTLLGVAEDAELELIAVPVA